MKAQHRHRLAGTIVLVLLFALALGLWQRQALARLAIAGVARSFAHVDLGYARASLGWHDAAFDDVRIASLRGQPIAEIPHVALSYDLRDLFAGGRRLFGLKSIEVTSPHVEIVRYPDGTLNVPLPRLNAGAASRPVRAIFRARVTGGRLDAIDETPFTPLGERRFYVEDLQADADISTVAVSRYTVTLRYGERAGALQPVRGAGIIDVPRRFMDQHWTAPRLPVAAAIDFAMNSPAIRFTSGRVENVDLRYVGFGAPGAAMQRALSAAAEFEGGRILIAGLSRPVDDVRGAIAAYGDGLVTDGLAATIAGAPATISGGIYDLRSPHLRIAVRGSGSLTRLRSAFAQGNRLPVSGPLQFTLLAEGPANHALTWIDLASPQLRYANVSLRHLRVVAAYDGKNLDVAGAHARYGGVALRARGRVAFVKERGAVEMLLGVRAPPGSLPYATSIFPRLALNASALASADDPKTIGVRGMLWGSGPGQHLSGTFDVEGNGRGTIGPIVAGSGRGSLYTRIALDRPRRSSLGLVVANDFPVPDRGGALSAAIFGGEGNDSLGVTGDARLHGTWGDALARGRVAMRDGTLRGAIAGNVADAASFGAALGGTARSPALAGTVVVANGRYRDFAVNGDAGVSFADGTLRLSDAALAVGPLFVGLAGTVQGLLPSDASAAHFDLAAQLHTSDARALVAMAQPTEAQLVQGSIDADVRILGTVAAPSFAGTVDVPEGSVNGLSFRDLRGVIAGTREAVSLHGARVSVGSSQLAINGSTSRAASSFGVSSQHVDLADFNDFFDAGDTLAGTGRFEVSGATRGSQIVATSGSAALSDARFRRISLGTVDARWTSAGSAIATRLNVAGPDGTLALTGSIVPATRSINAHAAAQNVDLAAWLPMLGLNAPITGRLSASSSISGTYPDLDARLSAAIEDGTLGTLPLERFVLTASATRGLGRLDSATVTVPGLTTVGSGTFGLHAGDPLAIAFASTSSDIGTFLDRAGGKRLGVSGAFQSVLRIEGTRAAPALRDSFSISSFRRGGLTIARVAAEIDVNRRAVAVRQGEIDLPHGRVVASAALPIALRGSGIAAADGPIAANVAAQDVELSDFANLLPHGTQLSGRIDGNVKAGGTVREPLLYGSLALQNGSYKAPAQRSPIGGIAADLAFNGSAVGLQSHLFAGGGAVTAEAHASLADLRRPATAPFTLDVRADRARFDLAPYFTGTLDGMLGLVRRRGGTPALRGDVAIDDARVALTALLLGHKSASNGSRLPDVAFSNVRIRAGKNVRVASANVDVGVTGEARLGGTLDAPSLAGGFRSTGGSIDFYRSFNIQSAEVTFDPSAGIVPDVNAVATTFVPNPATAIRLHVTGPATQMSLALASDPPYAREQILGLLVGAQQFGAVRGVASTGSGISAGSAAQNLALGQLNGLFTRTMLEPLSASLGEALGFSDVRITSDVQSGLGINAIKAFGKNVNAIFAESFGYPRTQSIALEAHPSEATGLRLTAYSSEGPTLFALQQQPQPIAYGVLNVVPLATLVQVTGTNGVTFSYQQRFP